MSRLRATLSSSPVDREIQGHVAQAERSLSRALETIRSASRDDMYGRSAVSRVRRDLERARDVLSGVRRVSPSYDASDPDLLPPVEGAPLKPVEVPVPEAPSEDVGIE